MSIDSNLIAESLGLQQSQVARHCFDDACFPKSSAVSVQLSFHSKYSALLIVSSVRSFLRCCPKRLELSKQVAINADPDATDAPWIDGIGIGFVQKWNVSVHIAQATTFLC